MKFVTLIKIRQTPTIKALIPNYPINSHDFSDYRRVLDRWPDLLNTFIQRVTTLHSSLLHTDTSGHSHVFNNSQQLNVSCCLTNGLTHQPILTSRNRQHRKHCSSVAVYAPLPSNGRCTVAYLATIFSIQNDLKLEDDFPQLFFMFPL
jgi:hypothetical protein